MGNRKIIQGDLKAKKSMQLIAFKPVKNQGSAELLATLSSQETCKLVGLKDYVNTDNHLIAATYYKVHVIAWKTVNLYCCTK